MSGGDVGDAASSSSASFSSGASALLAREGSDTQSTATRKSPTAAEATPTTRTATRTTCGRRESAELERGLERRRCRRCRTRRHLSFIVDPLRVGGGDHLRSRESFSNRRRLECDGAVVGAGVGARLQLPDSTVVASAAQNPACAVVQAVERLSGGCGDLHARRPRSPRPTARDVDAPVVPRRNALLTLPAQRRRRAGPYNATAVFHSTDIGASSTAPLRGGHGKKKRARLSPGRPPSSPGTGIPHARHRRVAPIP